MLVYSVCDILGVKELVTDKRGDRSTYLISTRIARYAYEPQYLVLARISQNHPVSQGARLY